MNIWVGLVLPDTSPLHCLNVHPGSGMADIVTVSPALTRRKGFTFHPWPRLSAARALAAGLDGLDAVDIVATDAMLSAGLLDRLRLQFPEIEESSSGMPRATPRLVVPPAERVFGCLDNLRGIYCDPEPDGARTSFGVVPVFTGKPSR